jgi:hypothetical protein
MAVMAVQIGASPGAPRARISPSGDGQRTKLGPVGGLLMNPDTGNEFVMDEETRLAFGKASRS